jgi:hypothetical protein
MRLIFPAFAFALITGSAANAATWEGEYAGGCGDNTKFQCDLLLSDVRGGKVEADLTISARADSTDVKCEIKGVFTRTGKSLQGQFGKSDRKIDISESSSGVILQGIGGKVAACGTQLDGEFDIMGE